MAMQLPDLPPGPCVDGVTMTLVTRCVEGVWELGWAVLPAAGSANAFAPAKPCGGTAANAYGTISHAINKGWEPDAVLKLAAAMMFK